MDYSNWEYVHQSESVRRTVSTRPRLKFQKQLVKCQGRREGRQ